MNKHAACDFSIFVKYIFNNFQNEEHFNGGEDCLAEFCDIMNDISLT